jgi:ureidoglycolate dehydrogenase (NAD+)
MAPKKVVVPATELTSFTIALFEKAGVSAEHARTIADVLIWAALRGVDSHGVARVPRYLELLDSGEANKSPKIQLTSGSPAVAVLDADRAPGPVALSEAAAKAVELAHANGIGAVGVRGTVHTGAIGYYVSKIAERGLVGIGFVAGMPQMSYTGVKGAAVATSPLAIAVPVEGHPPVLLDMATAGIALGKIAQYRNAGQELPEGMAATADGVPTTDPDLAKMPLPLGGAKGAGMSLAFELITSVLLGAPILSAFHGDEPGGKKHRQNALLLALDPNAFGSGSDFAALAESTVEALKELPRADEDTPIAYPGERSAAVAETRAAQGIPVGAKVWAELEIAADKLGVVVPEIQPG